MTAKPSPLRRLLRLWFGFDARVDRRAYAATGFSLMALKYAVDAAALYAMAGVVWTPLDYLSPLLKTRSDLLPQTEHSLVWQLLLWSLPFVWVGASMTLRRALDAGLPATTGLLFFVPVVNYLWMLTLCVLPSAMPRRADAAPERRAPVDLGSDVRAAALGALLGLGLTIVSVLGLRSYGSALFVGTPVVIGFVTAQRLNRPVRHSASETMAAAQLAVLFTAGAMLLFALEGVICLAMAWPLAAMLAGVGAMLGRSVASRHDLGVAHAVPLLLALPLLMGAESASHEPPLREVVSHIEIDAPPERVWPRVVGFSELSPPSRVVFELGISHPVRARIEGHGVGAVRYCEFSTGAFVEPITRWEPPHRLSFDVAAQPEPMHETSPYQRVHAPHLVDGLRSQRGEFRLVALPGGRTRLEGSTWYTIDMFPQAYWSPLSDALIHAIHARVLEHVKALAEGG